jgi:magnesium transporter
MACACASRRRCRRRGTRRRRARSWPWRAPRHQHFDALRAVAQQQDGGRRARRRGGFVVVRVEYALMDAVVDRYFPAIDAFDVELEAIEESIFTQGGARENIQRLYGLKQRLTVLKHAVAPLLEGANRLHGGRVPQVCMGTQEYFRDVLDHLSRINGTIDSMRDTIGTAIQANLSMVTIADGEVTKRLAAWAAIFAVCTAFVGVWGMNFEHMPELKWRYGYAMALALIVAICGYLYYRFRKAGWV